MHQQVVLAVDPTARCGEDLRWDKLSDRGELGPIDLRGDEAGGHQPTVLKLPAVVESRLGEPLDELPTQG